MELKEAYELARHALDVLSKLPEDISVMAISLDSCVDDNNKVVVNVTRLEDMDWLSKHFNVTPDAEDITSEGDTTDWVRISFRLDDRLAFECIERTVEWKKYMEAHT